MHLRIKRNASKIIFLIINLRSITLIPECVVDLSCLWHSTEVRNIRSAPIAVFSVVVCLLLLFIPILSDSAQFTPLLLIIKQINVFFSCFAGNNHSVSSQFLYLFILMILNGMFIVERKNIHFPYCTSSFQIRNITKT